ncbi:hypothetical protein C0993_003285 [Termitomyces sp. T159_Od127]|nr:hypothetical protein C0993_003285 [Termitomyces sp. T159_Od127]
MLKQQTVEYMLSSHKEQLQHGITPESVKITNSIGPLRDATVAGLVHVYDFMQTLRGRELVKKAWQKSMTKDWCLSEECLTSRRAQTALNDFLHKDPALRDEIEARLGHVDGIDGETSFNEDDVDHLQDDDADLSIDVIAANTHALRRGGARVEASDDIENVWAFDAAGEMWAV